VHVAGVGGNGVIGGSGRGPQQVGGAAEPAFGHCPSEKALGERGQKQKTFDRRDDLDRSAEDEEGKESCGGGERDGGERGGGGGGGGVEDCPRRPEGDRERNEKRASLV
jgi:hypothetical protein